MEEPAFSERIYADISRKVSERTIRSASKTKAKYEERINRLRLAVRSADHTKRPKVEVRLKQCEVALDHSLHRLETDSVSYLSKLGVRSTTSRDKTTSVSLHRPGTTGKITLLDRPGSRSWGNLAAGGKVKTILGEVLTQKNESNWDSFAGYLGPPYPARITFADLTSHVARDTYSYFARDAYHEYGTNMHPTCRKELPRHAKKATPAQALLYLKLREDKYTKSEAIKHSSNITFKTDSGLHQLKGTKDPFMFNGLHVRVPVSDPESRFKPVDELDEHKDFDMLSQAYEKFQRKYTVANGEYEPNAVFFSPRHHTVFRKDEQGKPMTGYARKRLAIPTTPKLSLPPRPVYNEQVLVDLQETPKAAVPSPSPPIVPPIQIQRGISLPVVKISADEPMETLIPTEQSLLKIAPDSVTKVEEAKFGIVSFRSINPKNERVALRVVRTQRSGTAISPGTDSDKFLTESSRH